MRWYFIPFRTTSSCFYLLFDNLICGKIITKVIFDIISLVCEL
jgi:hypothetical protein